MRETLELAGTFVLAIVGLCAGLGLLGALVLGYIWAVGTGIGLAVKGFCWASGLCA